MLGRVPPSPLSTPKLFDFYFLIFNFAKIFSTKKIVGTKTHRPAKCLPTPLPAGSGNGYQ